MLQEPPELQVPTAFPLSGSEASQQNLQQQKSSTYTTTLPTDALTSTPATVGHSLPRPERTELMVLTEPTELTEPMVPMEPTVKTERTVSQLSGSEALQTNPLKQKSSMYTTTPPTVAHTSTPAMVGHCLPRPEKTEPMVRTEPMEQTEPMVTTVFQSSGRASLMPLQHHLRSTGHTSTTMMVVPTSGMEPSGTSLQSRVPMVLTEPMVRMERTEPTVKTVFQSSGRVSLMTLRHRLRSTGHTSTMETAVHTSGTEPSGTSLQSRVKRATRAMKVLWVLLAAVPVVAEHRFTGQARKLQLRIIPNSTGHISILQMVAHIFMMEPSGHCLLRRETRVIRETLVLTVITV